MDLVSFHPDYVVGLPESHAFPMRKYALLHAQLVEEGLVGPWNLHQPEECERSLLEAVHDHGYVARLLEGTLAVDEVRRIGMPWSPALVRRARLAVQGTIDAARAALVGRGRLAGNLAGGTHHARRDGGEGYCALNDVVIATEALRREGLVRRVLVVDLDVHHGNGTAELFAGDPEAYTLSVHGDRNYPLRKPPSDLDVALPDGTGDEAYLSALASCLPRAIEAASAELAFYLAGVDLAQGDRFGRLALTPGGIAQRDRFVLDQLRDAGVAVCVVPAGGYALGDDRRTSAERTAALHAIVYREAASRPDPRD